MYDSLHFGATRLKPDRCLGIEDPQVLEASPDLCLERPLLQLYRGKASSINQISSIFLYSEWSSSSNTIKRQAILR